MQRHSSRRNVKPRWLSILPFFLLVLFVGVGYFFDAKLTQKGALPFRHIEVISKTHFTSSVKLQKALAAHIEGGFFSLDSSAISDVALSFPWVKSVSIRRVWPDVLVVEVEEYQPLAYWGAHGILTTDGTVFYPKEIVTLTLPTLHGPIGTENQVIENYRHLNQLAKPLQLSVQNLQLSDRLAWSLILNNHLSVILGEGDPTQRFTDFIQIYPKLIAEKVNKVAYVDMRYSNGAAIKWLQ